MNWPKPISGGGSFGWWLNQLLSCARGNVLKPGRGYRIQRDPNGFFLELLSEGGGGRGAVAGNFQIRKFQIKALLTDPFDGRSLDHTVCNSFTGSPEILENVSIAKPQEFRRKDKQFDFFYDDAANVRVNYTYFVNTSTDPSYASNFRRATEAGSGQSELQVVFPRYVTLAMLQSKFVVGTYQEVIWAINTNEGTGVKDGAGNDVTWLEISPHRVWARYQSS